MLLFSYFLRSVLFTQFYSAAKETGVEQDADLRGGSRDEECKQQQLLRQSTAHLPLVPLLLLLSPAAAHTTEEHEMESNKQGGRALSRK